MKSKAALLTEADGIKNFLVKGNINKNPTISVRKPGMISNRAAKAKAAPDIIS